MWNTKIFLIHNIAHALHARTHVRTHTYFGCAGGHRGGTRRRQRCRRRSPGWKKTGSAAALALSTSLQILICILLRLSCQGRHHRVFSANIHRGRQFLVTVGRRRLPGQRGVTIELLVPTFPGPAQLSSKFCAVHGHFCLPGH